LLHREQEQAIEQDIESYQPLLTDLVGKIQGLSTVHSILSQSGWKPILLSRLCESIITGALHSVPSNKQFVYSVSPSTVKVNSSQAHHLTLVINELTTNVVKHALSKRDNVSISVDISRKNSNIILQYRDDGPGFPEIISNGDLSGTNIGFELIRGIVTQSLNGTVEITNKSGGVVTLTFENEKT
jgi:two-component sensor histidine kinase